MKQDIMKTEQIKTTEYLEQLYQNFDLDPGNKRRSVITDSMDDLGSKGINCHNCPGYCCTYAHNSMLMTPLETVELLDFLISENRVNEKLIENLKANVKEFRLDKEIFIGKGREFRRNYTCPFFLDGPKGCSVSPGSKPYGCLGFNPTEAGVTVRGRCTSDLNALQLREDQYITQEQKASDKVTKDMGLYWTKKNIPSALLELIQNLGGLSVYAD